ncbi:hypothetical protein BDZ45DRAFT_739747 [Acephala macrosclerotiorum]|nr:hypothetical protein BDZ45DRAFT_739747 [Acephala macrosclerotiorum]
MLQSIASRVCTVTVSSLFVTILMYMTLTHVEIRTPIPKKIISGWGDGWASLLAPGEPLERMTMRSPSGQFVFSIESNGDLLFQDCKLRKNTTLFSQKRPSGGVHGLGDGVHVPESATWHAMLTRRGIFVVYFDVPKSPEVSTSRKNRLYSTKTEDKRGDEDLGDLLQEINEGDSDSDGEDDESEEPNHGLGHLSFTAWDSNRLPDCHILPKYAQANSAPFLQLDDTGLLQISTANEVNCILKRPEERPKRP